MLITGVCWTENLSLIIVAVIGFVAYQAYLQSQGKGRAKKVR